MAYMKNIAQSRRIDTIDEANKIVLNALLKYAAENNIKENQVKKISSELNNAAIEIKVSRYLNRYLRNQSRIINEIFSNTITQSDKKKKITIILDIGFF